MREDYGNINLEQGDDDFGGPRVAMTDETERSELREAPRGSDAGLQEGSSLFPDQQPSTSALNEGAGGGGPGAAEAMQGFQPQQDGDFGQQGFQYQDRQQMGEPAPGPSGAQPPCPMPNKTIKLVALICQEVGESVKHLKIYTQFLL